MTMLCVTHEMGFARQVANRIVFMDEGQIVEANDAEGVLRQSAARADQAVPQPDFALREVAAVIPRQGDGERVVAVASLPNRPTDVQCASGPLAFFQASMPPWMWQARGKPGVLRGLHRHGRALAEGAVEHQPLAGRLGQLVQHAARADVLLQARIGHMQRARDDAVALALGALAQVDQRDVRLADQRRAPAPPTPPSRGARPPPGAGRPSCWPAPRRPSSSDWRA